MKKQCLAVARVVNPCPNADSDRPGATPDFGGPGSETGVGAAFLALDRIALVGRTTSATGLGTSGVAQSTPGYIGGSVGDGYLASFSISGTRQWATYVGSYYTAVDDVVNDVVGTSDGTAIITGGAGGSLGTSGSWDPTWNGSQDAFVGAYSSSGAKLWRWKYRLLADAPEDLSWN